jgi:hypothetical protein
MIMPTVQIEKEQLLDAVLQMPQRELEQFVAKAFTLKARERSGALPEREAELLLKINQELPVAIQQRLNELIGKRRDGTMTDKERRELKKLTDQVEKSDAERLELLTELAHLRGVPLRKLVDYVPRNIVDLMCPRGKCGRGSTYHLDGVWITLSWEHNF